MHIAHFPIGPLDTNCFLLYDDKEAVVIDPGGDPTPIIRHLDASRLTLTHILLTHLHYDHTAGIKELTGRSGATAYASAADSFLLDEDLGRGGIWGLPRIDPYTFAPLEPGPLQLLGTTCTVLATPGHTPGGLSFYFPEIKAVFAGDSLFYRSIGRTDFPGGNTQTLLHSIRTQLFTLPEDTTVYPGHGPETSIGDEKRNNPHASDFSVL